MMRKLLSIFALLTAASMLLWIAGCGGDDEEEEVVDPPVFESWSITAGQELAGNATITATFDKSLDSATITVTGATGTTTVAGKAATWVPTGDIPPGAHTATVTGTNAGGDGEGTPVNFTAIAPDVTDPELATCDPKNGASGVDPADYPETITVGFSEAVTATIVSKDPDFKSTEEMSADGKEMIITFLQYSMPNETPFTLEIEATDNSGNTATLEYSFETMAKEQ
jgi:hypothetical protein